MIHEMEVGFIEGIRFIASPPLVLKGKPWKTGRRKPHDWEREKREMDSHWKPLFKEVRAHQPRVTAQRSASSRRRKAIGYSMARRVPAGWIAFL
jgi:hypothetical protein